MPRWSLRLLVACMRLLLVVPMAQAAITEIGTSLSGDTGSPDSATHTLVFDSGSTGSNRFLICGVTVRGNQSVLSMTYDGLTMTLIGSQVGSTVTGIHWFYRLDPPTGPNNVVTTFSIARKFVVGCLTLAGVDQTTPYTGFLGSTSGTANTTMSITLTAGQWALGILGLVDSINTITLVADGAVEEWTDNTTNATTANNTVGEMASKTGTGSTTISWTHAATTNARGVVAINPAAEAVSQRRRSIFFSY
jgi:hypothetical protein